MTITIPNRQTKALRQSGRSNIFGDISSSFGLDLQSNLGVIRLSPRLRINTSGVSNQGRAVAFRNFDQVLFAICGTRVFKTTTTNLISAFTEDASSGAITTYDATVSDAEIFNSTLVTTGDTKVMSKTVSGSGTGAWTQRATIQTGAPHKLCFFKRHNRIYYIDSNHEIKSLDTSWTEATSGSYYIDLTFQSGNPYTMETDSNYIYIGMVNVYNSSLTNIIKSGSILVWDGKSSSITAEYKIKAQGVLAMCKDDRGVIYAIDSNGALLQQTAGGFEEIDRLPIKKELLINALSGIYNAFIHPNGMTFSRNGTFIFNINNLVGDNGSTIKENFPSGIWEWSKETGFVHRQAYTLSTLSTSEITDFGQNRVSAVGALYEPNIYSASSSGKPTLICGATYYTNASSTADGIFVDDPLDTLQKNGYFVTSWILSNQLKDEWQKVWVKLRQLLSSDDKIIVKYRATEVSATEISITWVNTTSFTTSTDVSALVGYEVEVIQGTGSGKCSHIVSVSGSGPYTVTVDETYTGVTTGTAKARLQAWKKCGSFTNQTEESAVFPIGKKSIRIQVKVCMLFTGEDEILEFALINKEIDPLI